jgi:capsular polysaccharide biosynthesis protein
VAVGAAGVLSTGLAFTIDYLDPALRTPDEVIMYLNAPVLATLPKEVA